MAVPPASRGPRWAPDPDWKDPVVEAYKKDIDRTLVRQSLRLTPEERILRLMELQRLHEEARRAVAEARRRK